MGTELDAALLLLRLYLGLTFLAYSAQKLLGYFDGTGLDGYADWVASLGLQPARALAVVGGLTELAAAASYSQALEPGKRRNDAARFDGHAGSGKSIEPLTVTSEEWSLIFPPFGRPPLLYHLPDDPGQERDVSAQAGDVVATMRDALLGFLREQGIDRDRLAAYQGEAAPSEVFYAASPSLANAPQKLFGFEDGDGRIFAFATAAAAEANLSGDLADATVTTYSLDQPGRIDTPRPLILLDQQYYHPSDLIDGAVDAGQR